MANPTYPSISDKQLIKWCVLRLVSPERYFADIAQKLFDAAKERGLWDQVLVEAAKRKFGIDPVEAGE